MVAMYKAFKDGDIEKALKIDAEAHAGLLLAVPSTAQIAFGAKIDHSTEGYSKAVSGAIMGVDLGPPMAPYKAATEAQKKAIKEMVAAGKRPTYLPAER